LPVSKQPFSSLKCSNRAEIQQVGISKETAQGPSPWTNPLPVAEVPDPAEQHVDVGSFLSLKIPKIAYSQ